MSHRRTHITDTHSRTHAETPKETCCQLRLPREFINKIASQLKSYMTFLSSEVLEAVQQDLLLDAAAEHC